MGGGGGEVGQNPWQKAKKERRGMESRVMVQNTSRQGETAATNGRKHQHCSTNPFRGTQPNKGVGGSSNVCDKPAKTDQAPQFHMTRVGEDTPPSFA